MNLFLLFIEHENYEICNPLCLSILLNVFSMCDVYMCVRLCATLPARAYMCVLVYAYVFFFFNFCSTYMKPLNMYKATAMKQSRNIHRNNNKTLAHSLIHSFTQPQQIRLHETKSLLFFFLFFFVVVVGLPSWNEYSACLLTIYLIFKRFFFLSIRAMHSFSFWFDSERKHTVNKMWRVDMKKKKRRRRRETKKKLRLHVVGYLSALLLLLHIFYLNLFSLAGYIMCVCVCVFCSVRNSYLYSIYTLSTGSTIHRMAATTISNFFRLFHSSVYSVYYYVCKLEYARCSVCCSPHPIQFHFNSIIHR